MGTVKTNELPGLLLEKRAKSEGSPDFSEAYGLWARNYNKGVTELCYEFLPSSQVPRYYGIATFQISLLYGCL
jgi:hypothetical protein